MVRHSLNLSIVPECLSFFFFLPPSLPPSSPSPLLFLPSLLLLLTWRVIVSSFLPSECFHSFFPSFTTTAAATAVTAANPTAAKDNSSLHLPSSHSCYSSLSSLPPSLPVLILPPGMRENQTTKYANSYPSLPPSLLASLPPSRLTTMTKKKKDTAQRKSASGRKEGRKNV